jgi:two-component system response regulator HupR/HoxA
MGPSGDMIGAEYLSRRVLHASPLSDTAPEKEVALAAFEGTLKERIESVEAVILRESLIRNRWNKSRAAKELGLSRVGLRAKLERYGLEKIEALPVEQAKKKRAS